MTEAVEQIPADSVLLVVDVQNGFISPSTSGIVEKIGALIESGRFKQVIFTRYLNHDGSPYTRFLNWRRLMEAPETEIVDRLRRHAQTVIDKEVYTACGPELDAILGRSSAQTVFIAGIDTDCCVLTSAVDLFQKGVRPVVLLNYCASNGGAKSHEAAVVVLNRLIGEKQIWTADLS